ncbi:MAG: dCTP deaminase [Candidatus Zixiibacteriota bacterium]|nr:MAG: dCTP deaminase [candidate division Zixibacteria bacterium]
MAVKSDGWIIERARSEHMIEPFSEDQVRTGISFGVSCYGYDFRLSDEFKVPMTKGLSELDPKVDNSDFFTAVTAESVLIPANSFILGKSLEYFRIPRSVITICTGKSTYARCGIVVNVTPFEPEWEGYATLSLANASPIPVRIYANEGIAQLLFLEAAEDCIKSYKDKSGKYQNQQKITLPKLD